MYTNTILNNLPFENIAGIHQPFPLAGLQSAEIIHPPTNLLIDILKQHAIDYTKNHALPDHIIRTLRIINMCHTSALGGHVESCPDGHVSRIFYNSCGNRCCPRCAPRLRIGWLERRREVILPVQHFHVVITLAHTFNQLWKSNTKILGELFFHIAKEVLSDFLSDNRWLGADEIGMTMTLETWDDRLFFHPHLHILVTGGGLSSEGNWIDVPNPRILVHVKPLMWEFRKRFCAALKQMLLDGVLSLNDGSSVNYWIKRIKTANHKKWAVFIAPPPEEGGPTTDDILR
jgi:hypothetical protein